MRPDRDSVPVVVEVAVGSGSLDVRLNQEGAVRVQERDVGDVVDQHLVQLGVVRLRLVDGLASMPRFSCHCAWRNCAVDTFSGLLGSYAYTRPLVLVRFGSAPFRSDLALTASNAESGSVHPYVASSVRTTTSDHL